MSVVVYDLETSGVHPACDRIVQFAGVRATDDLSNIVAEANFLVALDPDVVPDPEALLVGQLSPQRLREEGVPEHLAVTRMAEFFGSDSPTLRVGYNSIAFDDEFVRYANWRNMMNPYREEWSGGNRRMDAQTLCRAASVLTPSAMPEWPVDEDGEPTYRLGRLIEAAGLDFEERAHDALSDSKATLNLLRHIRQSARRLWQVCVDCANKRHASAIATRSDSILMHVSPFYGNARRCSAPLAYVGINPTIGTRSIHVDLAAEAEPEMLLDLPADAISERLFAKSEDGVEVSPRPPLHQVAHNAAPFLVDLTASEGMRAGAIASFLGRTIPDGPNHAEVLRRHKFVVDNRREIEAKMGVVFKMPDREDSDAELALYQGFLSDGDGQRAGRFRDAVIAKDADGALEALGRFEDDRLMVLAERFWAKVGGAPDHIAEKYAAHVDAARTQGFGTRRRLCNRELPLELVWFLDPSGFGGKEHGSYSGQLRVTRRSSGT